MNHPIFLFLQLFLLGTLPYALLGYIPFWNSLRYPKRRVLILAFILLFLNTCVLFFGLDDPATPENRWLIYNLMVALITFIFFKATVKANVYARLYVFFIMAGYSYFILCMATFLVSIFSPSAFYLSFSTKHTLAHFISLVLTYPFVLFFISRKVKPNIKSIEPSSWKSMCFLPLFFYIALMVYSGDLSFNHVANLKFISMVMAIFAASSLVYYLTIKMIEHIRENTLLKQRFIQHNNQLSLQQSYYEFLQSHIEETKKSRHDLHHHLNTLYAFLENKDYESLIPYLNGYAHTLNNEDQELLYHNQGLSSPLYYYGKIAKESGIPIRVSEHIQDNISFPDSDLATLIGATLDNTIKTCLLFKEAQPSIHITLKTQENHFLIVVKNEFSRALSLEECHLFSEKIQEEGLKISSIKTLVDKYCGFITYDKTAHHFKISISLPLELRQESRYE